MMNKLSISLASCLLVFGFTVSCQSSNNEVVETKKPQTKQDSAAQVTLLLSQAQFTRDKDNRPRPGAAKLRVVELNDTKLSERILEDEESRVFHKALCTQDQSLWTIGATGAHLKEWDMSNLSPRATHYSGTFGGKWDRLRDIEEIRGADGSSKWAVATHDQGHVLVLDQRGGNAITVHKEPTTFVHEIEVGDFNGDGLDDFATTPSKPNKSGKSQPGRADAFVQSKDGTFSRMVALEATNRHAKEILATDLNGDGQAELYVVLEGRLGPKRALLEPVKIVQVQLRDGKWTETGAVEIPQAKQARVLLRANLDNDVSPELLVTTMKQGIWMIDSIAEPAKQLVSGKLSSGFEHAAQVTDINSDGIDEIFVSAEDQDQLSQWTFKGDRWTHRKLVNLGASEITWSIEVCSR